MFIKAVIRALLNESSQVTGPALTHLVISRSQLGSLSTQQTRFSTLEVFLLERNTRLANQHVSNAVWIVIFSDALSTIPVLIVDMPERKQHKECSYIILTLTGLKRSSHKNILAIMDDSSYRLNFDLDKKNKIHHHS